LIAIFVYNWALQGAMIEPNMSFCS